MVKKGKTKYKKAPQAPRRFKSAYMFFSTTKHKEIREDLKSQGKTEKTTNIAKMVSKEWKELPPEERQKWDEMARQDKARYEVERSLYTGPWKVPAKKKSHKDPNAPKRPMSAFLAYSHAKRAEIKKQNPKLNNAEISRVLAQMWKEAPNEEKQDHIDHEYELRQKYLREIAVWRETTEKEFEAQRKNREDMALKTVAARANAPDDDPKDSDHAQGGPHGYDKDNASHPAPPQYGSHYPYAAGTGQYPPYAGAEYSYHHPAYYQAEHHGVAPEHMDPQAAATEADQQAYEQYYAATGYPGYGHYPSTAAGYPEHQQPATGQHPTAYGGYAGDYAAAAAYGGYYAGQYGMAAAGREGDADRYAQAMAPRDYQPPRYDRTARGGADDGKQPGSSVRK